MCLSVLGIWSLPCPEWFSERCFSLSLPLPAQPPCNGLEKHIMCCAGGVISSWAAVLHLESCMPHGLGTNLFHVHVSAGQAVPEHLIRVSLWQEPPACSLVVQGVE